MLSKKFINTIKLNKLKSYEIAHAASMHPSTLSRLVCGIEKIKIGDSRIVDIGKVIGLKPEECFDMENEN